MSCGIYKITNTINDKAYIGQSIHIEDRWNAHCSQKNNSLIHRSIVKYGKNNFIFEILEECSQEMLDEREIYWINYYNSVIPNGYNLLPGGQSGDRSFAKREKEVLQYDFYGKLINRYPSCSSAALATNTRPANISACCRHETSATAGCQWRYSDDQCLDLITDGQSIYKRKVTQYDLYGMKIKQFNSVKDAAAEFQCSTSIIIDACNGSQYTAKGFRWAYNDNPPIEKKKRPRKKNTANCKKVAQYDKEGQLLNKFNSKTTMFKN